MSEEKSSQQKGFVQTVTGLVAPGDLGKTLSHEHLLLDIFPPDQEREPERKITLGNLGETRRLWGKNPLNARLDSEEDAIAELACFKEAGGGTVVEVTSIGLKRDPEGLARISRATGVHVVMGCSYYVHNYQPEEVKSLSEEEIIASIIGEIREGVGETGIHAGIIGEVGLFWPVHECEDKVLQASAVAQIETGAPLMVHPGRYPEAPMRAIEVVKEAGGDTTRTIMAHIDRTLFDRDDMFALADTGCILEFDLFGHESSFYYPAPIDMPNDALRIDHIQALIAAGYGGQLLVSHDICHKHRLIRYGGDGYAHLLNNVAPIMARKGMSEQEINALFIDNPARILAFA